MNDLQSIEKKIQREELLETYEGQDRVVLASDKLLEIQEQKKNRPHFSAKTEIPALDECTDGFRKGQLIIVSGPPKHGKTAFCQTLTKRFDKQGHKIVWFSYELGYEELFEKFPMENLSFYVPNYVESVNVKWIEDRVIESKQKYGTEIVFIDHLDFLRDPDALKGIGLNLSAYVGGIVQKIKSLAVQQNVLIFLMSHIRKNNWAGKELPSAEELRDSGQVAQLADMVLMIMRKISKSGEFDIYDGTNGMVGVMANRHNGKTRKIPIMFKNGEFNEIDQYANPNLQPESNPPLDREW